MQLFSSPSRFGRGAACQLSCVPYFPPITTLAVFSQGSSRIAGASKRGDGENGLKTRQKIPLTISAGADPQGEALPLRADCRIPSFTRSSHKFAIAGRVFPPSTGFVFCTGFVGRGLGSGACKGGGL